MNAKSNSHLVVAESYWKCLPQSDISWRKVK